MVGWISIQFERLKLDWIGWNEWTLREIDAEAAVNGREKYQLFSGIPTPLNTPETFWTPSHPSLVLSITSCTCPLKSILVTLSPIPKIQSCCSPLTDHLPLQIYERYVPFCRLQRNK